MYDPPEKDSAEDLNTTNSETSSDTIETSITEKVRRKLTSWHKKLLNGVISWENICVQIYSKKSPETFFTEPVFY